MSSMTHHKKLHQLFVWSAIFAVLVASLVPPITRAIYKQTIPAPQWVEVCTHDGLQHLPAALLVDGQSPDSQPPRNSDSPPGGHLAHCSFCVTQACSFGLAPIEAVLLPLMAVQGHDLPSHALPAPYVESGWQPNQPRAPPVFL